MSLKKLMTSISAVAVLALLSQPASVPNADHALATTNAIAVTAIGDDTASIPDFDGDGTIGFGDFVKFAAKFGLGQGDVGYDAQFDLNDDAEIGFADLLIFAENFGKEVTPPDAGGVNKMYWADGSTQMIQRSNLDGSDVEDLVTTGLDYPHGIALDVDGGKMYWTDFSANKIQRSNLDGSGVEDLITGLTLPYAIALDVSGGKMYWTDVGTDKIQRSNLDGSGVEDLVTGLTLPFAIALDVSGGKMYWTNLDKGNKIQRSNLDGSGVEDLVTGLDDPRGIALDVAGGKMYWTDWGANKIQRANLDGSGIEDLVTTGLDDPLGIALDVSGGKMYWTDSYYGEIRRSNLDGSGVEVLVTGLESPRQIALDSIPVEAGPDLAVEASVSEKKLTQEQSFTLSVTVRNRGTDQAAGTMLRYYRSDDETIDNTDTQVGTAAVNSLASLATTSHSIDLTAPANTGTYYYGACVDPVSGESNIGNNCSSGVNVAVSGAGTAVTIPDANLRAVIETALNKDSGAPITRS